MPARQFQAHTVAELIVVGLESVRVAAAQRRPSRMTEERYTRSRDVDHGEGVGPNDIRSWTESNRAS